MQDLLASGRFCYDGYLVKNLQTQVVVFRLFLSYLICVITKGCFTAAWAAFCAMLFCCCVIPSGA